MSLDSSSEEDNESELNDLRQLTAVLTADEASTFDGTSQYSAPVASTSKASTTSTQELRRIESAIGLNRLYEEKLQRLEKLLVSRLSECREKLRNVQNHNTVLEKNEVFRYVWCGKPYFKDKIGYPAPDNQDALLAQSEMYDFSLIFSVPGWSFKDKSQFMFLILKLSREIRKRKLLSEIAALRRQKETSTMKLIDKQIDVLEKEITNIGKASLAQVALSLDEEYDWDRISIALNHRHTASEYQRLWKLYFHPAINKNSWNKNESDRLSSVAAEHNLQNWDAIAAQLDTKRTGYQCFVYYCTNMTNNYVGKKWTPEEVCYLKRLVEYFKEDNYIPWGKIAAAMENRTKIQIYNKYMRLFAVRKGRFLPEEDAVILSCVDKFGCDFKRMTSFLPGRSISQLRTRFRVINEKRVSSVWSPDDDKKLLQVMSNLDDDDRSYSEATKYFPGKSRTSIRTRHLTLLKWLRKNPNLDLSLAPRRGARRLNHGLAHKDLNEALESLKNTLNTKVSTKSKNKVTVDSTETEIEDAIIALLVNESIQDEEKDKPGEGVEMLNNETVNHNNLSVNNLRKSLIILESCIDRTKFNSSNYSETYPNLANEEQDVCVGSVKCYSKKNVAKSKISTILCPNIFGDVSLGARSYVLPPHYSTLTGCRNLISYVAKYARSSSSIYLISKKNPVLREHFDILLERFYILFLWPMILSNEAPRTREAPLVVTEKRKRPAIPSTSEISVPFIVKRYKSRKDNISDTIDLEETRNATDNTCVHPNSMDWEHSDRLSGQDISALLNDVEPWLRKSNKRQNNK